MVAKTLAIADPKPNGAPVGETLKSELAVLVERTKIQIMPTTTAIITWLEVSDDAVKIGLGALIAGLFAWLVARHGSKSAIEKMQFERRSKLLGEIADTYEEFFQSFVKFSSCLSGVAAMGKGGYSVMSPMLKSMGMDPGSLREQINEKLKDTFTAQSRLMLLGEAKCEWTARELQEAISLGLKQLNWDGATCDTSQLPQIVQAIGDARKSFYSEMKLAFDKR